MKQTIKTLTITISTLTLIFLSQWSYATVLATVSTNEVAKGEIFILKVVSDHRANANDLDFSILESDFYVGNPSFSSSMNSVNGKRTIRSEWTLSLAPLRIGSLNIPAFQVQGEKTTPVLIQASLDSSTPEAKDLVIFQSQLSKNDIYPAEITQLDTRLIIKTDVRRIQNPKFSAPSSKQGVDIEPIGDSHQYLAAVDGIESTIIEQSYRISSSESGSFIIEGPTLTATILDRNNKTGSTRLIPVNTTPKQIPLHVAEKPANLKGAWLPSPNLALSQKWLDGNGHEISNFNEQTITVGSPITREITLTIEGIAPSQLPNIVVNYPDSVRYYDEPPKINQDGNLVSMTLKHVLIPKNIGKTVLPDIRLHWWNTVNKIAETATLSGINFNAVQSDTPSIQLNSNPPQKTLPIQADPEIITIKESGIWPYLTALFALLWLLTLGLLLKKNGSKPVESGEQSKQSNAFDDLVRAIKNRDGMSAQAHLKVWCDENPQLEPTIVLDINKNMTDMMKVLYSNNSATWNDESLISNLNKAKKSKPKKNNSKESLATL